VPARYLDDKGIRAYHIGNVLKISTDTGLIFDREYKQSLYLGIAGGPIKPGELVSGGVETIWKMGIHAKLLKIWPDSEFQSIVSEMLYSSSFGLNELCILRMLKTFEEYGLKEWSEPVLDVLWKISYPILPLIDPSYNKCLEKGMLDDWRKVLENNPQSNYKPKTEQLPFDQ
jgi:hypothetical protein